MSSPLNPVCLLMPWAGGKMHRHQRTRITSIPIKDVLTHLRGMIGLAGCSILFEYDAGSELEASAVRTAPSIILLVSDPRSAARMCRADPAAINNGSWTIAVFERADKSVAIRWVNPAIDFDRYSNAPMARLGRELAMLQSDIIDASLQTVNLH